MNDEAPMTNGAGGRCPDASAAGWQAKAASAIPFRRDHRSSGTGRQAGLRQGSTLRWPGREKRSQNEAKVRGRTGHWEAGLLRKRPVFIGNYGVWPVRAAGGRAGENLQNEATANTTAGKRRGRCCNATPQSAGGAGIVCRSATNSTLRRVGDRRSGGRQSLGNQGPSSHVKLGQTLEFLKGACRTGHQRRTGNHSKGGKNKRGRGRERARGGKGV